MRSLTGRGADDMGHGQSVLQHDLNKTLPQTPRARFAVIRPLVMAPEISARVVTEPNPRLKPAGGAGNVKYIGLNAAVHVRLANSRLAAQAL